jgi:hypothetical protein
MDVKKYVDSTDGSDVMRGVVKTRRQVEINVQGRIM